MKGGGNLEFSELKSRLSHDDLLKVIEDVSQPYVLQVQTLISITNQSPSTMMPWRRSADSPNKKYIYKILWTTSRSWLSVANDGS